jgi:hypothetical protein
MFQPGPDWSGPPMAVLLNKTDLLTEEQIQELQEWYMNNCRAEKVRAQTRRCTVQCARSHGHKSNTHSSCALHSMVPSPLFNGFTALRMGRCMGACLE